VAEHDAGTHRTGRAHGVRWGATGGCDGRGGLHRWPEKLGAGGHASRPSVVSGAWRSAMRGPCGRVGLQTWPEGLEAWGHASLPSALAAKWRWLLSGHLSLATPLGPRIALRHAPPHVDRYAQSAARLYPDNPVFTASVHRRLRRRTARDARHSDGAGGKTCVDVSHSRAGPPSRARASRAVLRHGSPCPHPW
jgi:hypothetical protein